MAANSDLFTQDELLTAISKLKTGKAVKTGDVPAEALKALAAERGAALEWVPSFCNLCWTTKSIPRAWATASVAMIYKKSDPGLCDNYRPICLLSIADKAFASMLKQRLLDAGIEDRLWPSQFGFRRGCSTEDAIFLARRRIELARAQRNGSVSLLALDWAKAFDSINPASLLDALRRAGLPEAFLQMIDGMLRDREYVVADFGMTSEPRDQLSGISQGCTLSPLLFVVAMSVLLQDAVDILNAATSAEYAKGDLADVLYADDTLLLGVKEQHLEEFLRAIHEAGRRYGMELHYDKFQLITTSRQPVSVRAPDGTVIHSKPTMEYLGCILQGDGQSSHEISRRIAMARADFDILAKTWTHSAVTWKQKLHIYKSLVESKLLHSMATLTLTAAQTRKLNGFQNRCVRKIIGVPPAFVSRVSNATVLHKAAHPLASDLLRKKRLQLFGKILRADATHPLKRACFIPNTFVPVTELYIRRIGRPSKEWIKEVVQEAVSFFGSMETASGNAQSKLTWNSALADKFGF